MSCPPTRCWSRCSTRAAVLPRLLAALAALDYPPHLLDVRLLIEADDAETLVAVRRAELAPHVTIVEVPPGHPRTKPRALAYGLLHARGERLVVFDAEDRPAPDQLRRAVAAFYRAGPRVACLQARLATFNTTQNLLTRWFAADYAAQFDLVLPALARRGAPLPLGGTSNHFVTQQLTEVGGWDPYNVTEDADLGVRLHRAGLRAAVLDATTLEEATSELSCWVRQRSRWSKGHVQTLLVHLRHPLRLVARLGVRGTLWFALVARRGAVVAGRAAAVGAVDAVVRDRGRLARRRLPRPGVPSRRHRARRGERRRGPGRRRGRAPARDVRHGPVRAARPAGVGPGLVRRVARGPPAARAPAPVGEDAARPRRRGDALMATNALSARTLPSAPARAATHPGALAQLALFALVAAGYAALGAWLVAGADVVANAAVERLAHAYLAWHGEPAGLGALGTDVPPLTGLALLPFALIAPVATSLAALPAFGAVCGAVTVTVLDRTLARCGMRASRRAALLAAFALNPLVAFHFAAGTPAALTLALLALALHGLVSWSVSADPRGLLAAGVGFALTALTRYELAAWGIVALLAVAFGLAARGAREDEIEGSAAAFGAPGVAAFAVWTLIVAAATGAAFGWIGDAWEINPRRRPARGGAARARARARRPGLPAGLPRRPGALRDLGRPRRPAGARARRARRGRHARRGAARLRRRRLGTARARPPGCRCCWPPWSAWAGPTAAPAATARRCGARRSASCCSAA